MVRQKTKIMLQWNNLSLECLLNIWTTQAKLVGSYQFCGQEGRVFNTLHIRTIRQKTCAGWHPGEWVAISKFVNEHTCNIFCGLPDLPAENIKSWWTFIASRQTCKQKLIVCIIWSGFHLSVKSNLHCFGLAFLTLVVDLKILLHFMSQSELKPKPVQTHSHIFFDWLTRFSVIGPNKNFAFSFMTLNWVLTDGWGWGNTIRQTLILVQTAGCVDGEWPGLLLHLHL